MVDDKNKNFEKLVSFLTSSGWDVSKRTGDDSKYEQFLKAFPKTSLEGMSLDQYCVGDGKNTSFCWWIERGLQPAFGRYMPGTSKGHILYKLEDGSIYKNARLKAMPDEAALAYTLKIQQALVNADDNESLTWIDDDKEVFKKAGVQPIVSMGEGRKLRLLSVYRPDTFIPIASSGHIGHFLLKFGVPPENVPSYEKPISRMNALYEIYEAVKDKVSGLSPYVFMKALYEPTLGLKPVKDLEEKASKMSELEETALQQAITTERSLNTILYGPPGTGKTYATIDEALIILDPGFYASYPDDIGAELEIQEERRRILKARYDQLVEQGHIRFVTFHQSFREGLIKS